MPDVLILHAGYSQWLRRANHLACLLALAALLVSRAEPAWVAVAAILLVCVCRLTLLAADNRAARGRLHLAGDGSALLFAPDGPCQAHLCQAAWTSRALCVLQLQATGSGKRFRVVVCRSLNSEASYRRLLQRLRLIPEAAAVTASVSP